MYGTHRAPLIALLALVVTLLAASTAFAEGDSVNLIYRGTGTLVDGPNGAPQSPAASRRSTPPADLTVQQALARFEPSSRGGGEGTPTQAETRRVWASNPLLELSFDGLTQRDQFFASEGSAAAAPTSAEAQGGDEDSAFAFEPPDQGLCAGNGYVLESVNSAVQLFDGAGAELTAPIDLAAFYGNPLLFDPDTGFGVASVDVSCVFDPVSRSWIHIALTLELNPATGIVTGVNHLDIAVSKTANPRGLWSFYALPLQNDGTQGTPNDHCSLQFCLGDFPHVGVDDAGVYVTTNEYSLFGGEFHGANVYAISKRALTRGDAQVTAIRLSTAHRAADGRDGFALWAATSPGGQADRGNGGTEYLLNAEGRGGSDLGVWAVTNTRSLDTGAPALALHYAQAPVEPYVLGVPAVQKTGDFPLGQCINDTTSPTPLGPGCWRLLLPFEPAHTAQLERQDAGDNRIQQVTWANGALWTTQATLVDVGGSPQNGVGLYRIEPRFGADGFSARVLLSQRVGVAGEDLLYPSLAINADGSGAMAFTVVGPDRFPSAGYAGVGPEGMGGVQVAAEGLGPEDGLSGYPQLFQPRQRWGDYSAAAADGNRVWLATEYIGQTCTLAQYMTDPECGGTRTALANWYTRVSRVKP